MKRVTFLLFFLFFFSCQLSMAREVVNINRDWQFSEGYGGRPGDHQTVQLPHSWNTAEKGQAFSGAGTYHKRLMIPSAWSGQRVYIRFRGANRVAQVFINGRYVGEHAGGFTAFTFDITRYLRFGQSNTILVQVSNGQAMNVLPLSGAFNTYGGLYRDVDLIVTPQEHISLSDYGSEGVYLIQQEVTPERARMEALIKITARQGSELYTLLEVFDGEVPVFRDARKVPEVVSGERTELQMPFHITRPHLWNGVNDPYLYTVKVTLADGEQNKLDSLVVPLGVRYFHVDNQNGFFLNGSSYPLRGVTRHQDRNLYGAALTLFHHAEDLEILREMGANAVRLSEGPHDPAFYRLADLAGVVVWTQVPFNSARERAGSGFVNSRAFRENGERQLIEMIRQLYNHPSVCFWGIFDEISLRGESPVSYIKLLNETAHREDPSRLTAAASNQDGEINFITDLIAWNHYLGWKQGQPEDIGIWAHEIQTNWKRLKPGLSEYGAGANPFHQEDSLRKPQREDWQPERWQTHFHEEYLKVIDRSPFLWGTFIESLFDYGDPAASANGINELGLVTFDRHLRKDAFYFYKANWNEIDPFLYIAERRWVRRKDFTQTIRVFSNLEKVELWVNGHNLGETSEKTHGTFIWEHIELSKGWNEIIVRSGRFSDRIVVEIIGDTLAQ